MAVYHTTYRGMIQTGTLGEIFSHSHGIQSSASELVVAQALHDAWLVVWGTVSGELGSLFPVGVTYNEVTCAKVLDPTVPDLGAAAHVPFNPPLAGHGTSGGMLPSQCAIAVSLTAGVRPDGRPLKGRFYLPAPHQATVDSDGTLSSTETSLVATKFKTYFETLTAAGHIPSIWSRTDEDLVGIIDQVRCGNKVDTIRSRRNRYPEVYSVQAVVGPS